MNQDEREAAIDHLLSSDVLGDELIEQARTLPKSSSKAQVPMMITIAMRARLVRLGWGEAEINHLTPAEAWKILNAPQP
jgi:hypothetical protein